MINELLKKYCFYYIGVKDSEEITLFDNVEMVNKIAVISAEDLETAWAIFSKKSGITKRNVIGIKQGKEWLYRG